MASSEYLFKMANCYWIVCFAVLSIVHEATAGDSDAIYRACVRQCEKTGCTGDRCFSCCEFSPDGSSFNAPWYMPIYFWWKQSDCKSNCRYHCMFNIAKERADLGQAPVKFNGKWASKSLYGIQEPISVAFSALNLLMHFHCWRSFSFLLYYSLPLKPDKTPFYEYSSLFNLYGILSVNAWFWSAVFHSRDIDLTEKLHYSSAIFLLGYSIILAIIRSFRLRNDAARVMVAAPLLSFSTTHILFLSNFEMDYERNMKVSVAMNMLRLLIWSLWGSITRHSSRWKLWIAVLGDSAGILLEVLDFPPYQGLLATRAFRQALNIPLTYMWWSFFKDDAEYRTAELLKKVR